jgi:hypothetical protein
VTLTGAAEGGADDWGEVVTRYPYRKVGMDHLLSKESYNGVTWCFSTIARPSARMGNGLIQYDSLRFITHSSVFRE